jgi:FAD/FMN-containing dehydrogenase
MKPIDVSAPPGGGKLLELLRSLLGDQHVLTDIEHTTFFSTDIAAQGVIADAVIAPGDTTDLAAAVGLCTSHRHAVIPRGGGVSYTQAYTPTVSGSIIVDLRRLDQILEINTEDMYVTVACGCTWLKLHEALRQVGFRTPFFGPLSGFHATVGGALAQGAFFLGSSQYGISAESVLALEIVLADGSILRTGSSADSRHPSPFFRNYGPDLTGLFLQDCGALGFKASASLKIIPLPKHSQFATFSFADRAQSIATLSEIGRANFASECYLWDPIFGKQMREATSLADKLAYLRAVMSSGGPVSGLFNAVRLMARGGEAFAGKANLLHVTFDDLSKAGCDAKLKLARAMAHRRGGLAMEPAAPRAMRARPFSDFLPRTRQKAQARSLPMHGIFPHSKIQAANAALDAFFEKQKPAMERHGVSRGVIFCAVGSQAVCAEPLFYWTDPPLGHHDRITERSDLQALAGCAEAPPARRLVMDMRDELVQIFADMGASHAQIGKVYPFRQTRQRQTFVLGLGAKAESAIEDGPA